MIGHTADTDGLRALSVFGYANIVRGVAAIIWLGLLVQAASIVRPDLIHPTDFGSDTSNYAAAGERIIHASLYTLSPGDRPAPADNPPTWSVPILSPPTLAAGWAALLLLPDPFRFHLPWAAGLVATCGMGLFLIVRLPIVPMLASFLLFTGGLGAFAWASDVTAWSGNVNALLAPGMMAVWFLALPGRSRRAQISAGFIVAVLAMVKLGPVMLGLWLLTQRRWDAVVAAVGGSLAGLAITLLLAGPDAFVTYVEVARESIASPTPLSIPGLAAWLGLPGELHRIALVVVEIGAAIAIVLLRARSDLTFAIAVVAASMATTVVRTETLAVALAALAPWAIAGDSTRRLLRAPSPAAVVTMVSCMVGLIAVIVAVATGGLTRSSLSIDNRSIQPVVVRFSMPAQFATFGYRLEPDAAGVAWSDQIGIARSTVYVYSVDCRLLHRFALGAEVATTLRITNAGVQRHVATEGAFLSYAPACAAELSALLSRSPGPSQSEGAGS